MSMISLLLSILQAYISEFAGSKTMRYFFEPMRATEAEHDGAKYPKQLIDVVQTFIAVISKQSRYASVSVGGDYYPVSEYKFPSKWWELARGVRVYAAPASAGNATAWSELEGETKAILDPKRVEMFFNRFNQSQGEGELKIQLSQAPDFFGQDVSLLDFKALVAGENQLAAWNQSGAVDEVVAQVCGIEAPVDSEHLYCYPAMDEERVMRWLMSVE